jgi:integration host factor subunit alpha
MAITKADIADDIYAHAKISKKDARVIVEYFFDAISDVLEKGYDVRISGFGNFGLRTKSQRPGRNPKTKAPVPISARTVVTYKPSQKVKERVESVDPKLVEVSKRRESVMEFETEDEDF